MTPDPAPPAAPDQTSNQRPATSNQSRDARPPTPDPAGSVATATRALRIELRETEDEAADRERLARLLAALREFPGEDEVRLTLRTLDGGTQRVALPKARSCAELTARLREALEGAGTVAGDVGGEKLHFSS